MQLIINILKPEVLPGRTHISCDDSLEANEWKIPSESGYIWEHGNFLYQLKRFVESPQSEMSS